jgi:putative salt-induced outer membrane protein YdiY
VVCGATLIGLTSARSAEETEPLTSSLALGVVVNDGNTDNAMYNASFKWDYLPDEVQLLRLAVDGAYGETEGDTSTQNAKGVFDYQYRLSERTYGAFNIGVANDDLADLDYRLIVSPGLGYFFLKDDAAFLSGEAGPAWISEKKSGETSDDFALRVAQRYERKLESNAKVWQSAEYLAHFDDFDIYLVNAEIGVEAPISESLNIRLVVKNTYDSNPAPDREKNDLSVVGALAYSIF